MFMTNSELTNKVAVEFKIGETNLVSTIYHSDFDTVFHELSVTIGANRIRNAKAVLKAELSSSDCSIDTFGLDALNENESELINQVINQFESLSSQAREVYEAGGRGYAGFSLVREFLHSEVISALKERETLMIEAA